MRRTAAPSLEKQPRDGNEPILRNLRSKTRSGEWSPPLSKSHYCLDCRTPGNALIESQTYSDLLDYFGRASSLRWLRWGSRRKSSWSNDQSLRGDPQLAPQLLR